MNAKFKIYCHASYGDRGIDICDSEYRRCRDTVFALEFFHTACADDRGFVRHRLCHGIARVQPAFQKTTEITNFKKIFKKFEPLILLIPANLDCYAWPSVSLDQKKNDK